MEKVQYRRTRLVSQTVHTRLILTSKLFLSLAINNKTNKHVLMSNKVNIFVEIMKSDLKILISAMLWDMPREKRDSLAARIISDPIEMFHNNEILLIRALNSLRWHDLISLIGKDEIIELLTDSTIRKLYPSGRRTYYTNARRLLSKYSLPSSGQGA